MTYHDHSGHGFTENPYFDRQEFECRCGCGYAVVDARLLEMLTAYRVYFDAPMIITSGARCLAHNAKVGGAAPKLDADHKPIWGTGSQHLWGMAADIVVSGVSPHTVYTVIASAMDADGGWGGLGEYREFTHVDVRKKKSRWRGHGVVNYVRDENGEDLA